LDFRKDINGLRAIAVVVVVLYHYGVPGFEGGYVGVDVFFVISGFLMTQAVLEKLNKGRFSLIEFYWARARRIIPALFVLLVVLLGIGAFRMLPLAYAELAKTSASAIAFVSNVLFWRQRGYFDTPPENSWLLHTWSLSVEWQFYLLYPLLLIFLFRFRSARPLLGGVLIVLVLSLALAVLVTPKKPEASFFLLPTRAWEMLAGAVVYLHKDKLRSPLAALAGVLMIAFATYFYTEDLLYPGHYAIVPVLGSALVIAARSEDRVLSNPVGQFLGNISYSLYLWHWPLIVGLRFLHYDLNAKTRVLLIVLSLLLSWLSYLGVEQIFRRLNGKRSLGYSLRCIAACSVLLAVCLVTFKTRGLPERVPPLAAKNDFLSSDNRFPEHCAGADGLCRLGPETPKRVLVWGDSHAEHLYPAFEQVAKDIRGSGPQLLLGISTGCLPVRGIDHLESRGGCERFNQRMFRRASQPDIEGIVLAAFWAPYFRERICRTLGDGCERFPGEEAALAAARQAFSNDVRELTRLGKRVSVILQVPAYPRSIASYLAEREWHGGEIELLQTRADHERTTSGVLTMLRSLSDVPGVSLLDPADVLCPTGTCDFQRNGISLYRDNNHLTGDAALLLVPMLTRAVRFASGENISPP
jgi:peptidoglycan/LPS O-acetylase OafA/YrhL